MRNRCARLIWVFLAMLLAAVAMGEPIHLRFVCWDGDQDMAGIFAAARQFERAHPNITVKVESVVANYQEKLLAQFASGTAPDVAMMDPANFQKYARRGALLPLNPLFKETPKFRLDGMPSLKSEASRLVKKPLSGGAYTFKAHFAFHRGAAKSWSGEPNPKFEPEAKKRYSRTWTGSVDGETRFVVVPAKASQ